MTGYVDWAYAGKVTVTLIILLALFLWFASILAPLLVQWDELARQDEQDRHLETPAWPEVEADDKDMVA